MTPDPEITAAGVAVTIVAQRTALRAIIARADITTVFQPIVNLETGTVLGYEALSRGPLGTAFELPNDLFAIARAEGLTRELDLACTQAALAAAARAGMRDPLRVFVNVEPDAAAGWAEQLPRQTDAMPCVVELTERELIARPAELLQLVDLLRQRGYGIALDDVGAHPASLALLPLLRPDVIKLDLRIVQGRPSADVAAIVNAVSAESERAGAVVLAEGIETPEHRHIAMGMGATLGQGWLFGRPAALPEPLIPTSRQSIRIAEVPRSSDRTPYDIVKAARPTHVTDKALLIEVTKHLEQQANAVGFAGVILASFQHRRYFTSATALRYAEFAKQAALVAVLGEDMPAIPTSGVTGVHIFGGDPLNDEWDIAVLSPYFAAALVARDRRDSGPESHRRFDYVLTHERELVVRVAQSLMSRIKPVTTCFDQ